ncbi:HAD family hydrolase [Myxococcaceae bacterium GXIMD 01537]
MVENVIFDVDGTLVDSVDEHAEAWRRAFLEFGRDAPFAHVRSQIGKGADQLLPVFFSDEELRSFGPELEAYRSRLFLEQFLPKVRPFPKVRELFERLQRDGVRTALASSAQGEELEHYVRICKLEGLVDTKTTRDDVERSKPQPDIFEVALARLGRPKARTVAVVGDSPYDALAAGKRSLATVGLLCGGFPAEDLRTAGCRALAKDPADLLARYEANPRTWPWAEPEAAQASKNEER